MSASLIQLDDQGLFQRDGHPFYATGFNYWPGSCGVELWHAWPEEEIRRDFALVAATSGFNTLRVFLRWQDFEPRPGEYEERMWNRLSQMLHWADAADIYLQPSLFVGFMSGGVFWPDWKQGSLFSAPRMRERAVAFAAAAAERLAEMPQRLVGVDLGNELCCLAESSAARPADVREWCAEVAAAVRRHLPGVPVVSGGEQSQVIDDTGWRFGEQPGTDFLSMHGCPVPSWHALPFDGMTDPFASHLLPFHIRCARAFAPVMLQEFGTIVTFGAREQDTYLRRMLPAARDAGANGFLWCCMRDFSTGAHPCNRAPRERDLGYFDAEDNIKPGLKSFQEFCRNLHEHPPTLHHGSHAVYWPREYYSRAAPANPGNDPRTLSSRMAITSYMLEQVTDAPTAVVRSAEDALAAGCETLWITGAALTLAEFRDLADWVRAGGRMVLLGVDPVLLTREVAEFLGFLPVDSRAGRTLTAEIRGEARDFSQWPRETLLEVAVLDAEERMQDQSGKHPLAFHARRGQGQVVSLLPYLEDTVLPHMHDPARRDRLTRWVEWFLEQMD